MKNERFPSKPPGPSYTKEIVRKAAHLDKVQQKIAQIGLGIQDDETAARTLARGGFTRTLDDIAIRSAMISAYLTALSCGGGHDTGMKRAERARRNVRKALGYSYPNL